MARNRQALLEIDMLNAASDDQLYELEAFYDDFAARIRANVINRTVAPGVENRILLVAEFFRRVGGDKQALDYIDELNRLAANEDFFAVKWRYLKRHGRDDDVTAYLENIRARKASNSKFLLLTLFHCMEIGQLENANRSLIQLISNNPSAAEAEIATILAMVFRMPLKSLGSLEKTRWGAKLLGLREKIDAFEAGGTAPIVHCINMDTARRRLERCHALYEGISDFRRLQAVEGNTLDDEALKGFRLNPRLPRSAIGCTLSHVEAWRRIASDNPVDVPQVVIEDDGLPIWSNRAAFETAINLVRNRDLDVLFVNSRTTPLVFAANEYSDEWRPDVLNFEEGLERFKRYARPLPGAWGADGYCLSARGAEKLLALVKRDGLTNHIDWQMFLYSIFDWEDPVAGTKRHVLTNYKLITDRLPKRELRTGILNFPLVEHFDFGVSTR